jgi:hypothetical protein
MRLAFSLAALASLSSFAVGSAGKLECVQAADSGQDLRDRGQLLAARERFLACGLDACPAVVRAQCQTWLAEVDRRTPTVLFRVRDVAGLDLVDVRGLIDGAPLERGLDGRSVRLDPGVHVFRFEGAGLEASELRALIRESEKDRLLDVTMRPTSAAAAASNRVAGVGSSLPGPMEPQAAAAKPSLVVPALAVSLGGVALAGAGLFAGFGADAKARVDHLRASCAPDCRSDEVEVAVRHEQVANASLIVGAVGAAGAGFLLAWRPPSRAPAEGLTFSVGAAPGGAAGAVSGRF